MSEPKNQQNRLNSSGSKLRKDQPGRNYCPILATNPGRKKGPASSGKSSLDIFVNNSLCLKSKSFAQKGNETITLRNDVSSESVLNQNRRCKILQ